MPNIHETPEAVMRRVPAESPESIANLCQHMTIRDSQVFIERLKPECDADYFARFNAEYDRLFRESSRSITRTRIDPRRDFPIAAMLESARRTAAIRDAARAGVAASPTPAFKIYIDGCRAELERDGNDTSETPDDQIITLRRIKTRTLVRLLQEAGIDPGEITADAVPYLLRSGAGNERRKNNAGRAGADKKKKQAADLKKKILAEYKDFRKRGWSRKTAIYRQIAEKLDCSVATVKRYITST